MVCTDLSGKEPHRQIVVGRIATSGSLGGEMVIIMGQNERDVSLIPALGTIFPISITPSTLVLIKA